MDTQEKFIHSGPHYPQGDASQYPQGDATQYPQSDAPQYQSQPPMGQYMGPTVQGQQGGKWQADLCSCTPCTSCLLAWCLPCLLLGETSERIRDPSMKTAGMINSDCTIHGLITCFTGCGWIYGMLKRSEIRERYNIEGSGFNDCCVSYWCSCCALIQQDNEVKIRQRNANPIAQGYQSQPGMQIPAPTYQPQH
ncbi:PLAC8-domain-containing protein [Hypoxylon rubiginosum]|uniref:PLAC8-domain-containing protein n=1 Tax=Hypoxylon rubiginosum TaxID=110542 RepID=A0ACB9YPB2_9PEZI|nr:PLAC8-domain-containing protein [Hypoxylon rubiginosum]